MCLVKMRQEEDVVVPYRVVHTGSPHRRRSARISHTHISERRSSRSSYPTLPAPKPYPIPAPAPLPIPAPQPVPVFVEPSPPPPPPPAPPTAHPVYVERHTPSRRSFSSESSESSRGDGNVIYEREYRRQRRDYSPSSHGERSPQYQTFRYLDAPEEPPLDHYVRRDSSRRRSASHSRDRRSYHEDPRDSRRRVTRERVEIVDSHGTRREYRR